MVDDISDISIGTVYKIKVKLQGSKETVTFYTTMSNEDSITINIEESSDSELIGNSYRIHSDLQITQTLTGKQDGEVLEFIEKIEEL